MMTTAVSLSPSPTPQNWGARYEQQLVAKFVWAIEFVQTNPPDEVRSHFPSLLTLLERGWQRPFLHVYSLNLIIMLHPWPVRWGWIDDWLFALESAVDVFRNLDRVRQQTDLFVFLAELLLEVGQFEQVLIHGQHALILAQRHEFALPMTRVSFVLYRALTSLGRAQEADDMLATIEAELPTDIPVEERLETAVWLTLALSRSLSRRGQHQIAYDYMMPLITQLGAIENLCTDFKAQAMSLFATLLWNMNRYVEGAQIMTEAVELYRQLGDHTRAVTCQADLSLIYVAMGEFERGEEMMQVAIAQAEKQHFYYQLAEYIGSLAGIYMSKGKLTTALLYLERQIQLTQITGGQLEKVRAIINRGGTRLLMGEYEAGLVDVEMGLPYYQSQNHQEMFTLCQLSVSYAYWGLARMAEGKALAEEILETVEIRLSSIPHLAIFARRCLALFSSPEDATVLLQEALALAQKHNSRMQEAACLLSLAALATDPEIQNALWEKGCNILIHVGATDWVDGRTPQNTPFIGMIH